MFYRKSKKNGGFTLVELLAVMAIIGILAIAVSGFFMYTSDSYVRNRITSQAIMLSNDIINSIKDETKSAKRVYLGYAAGSTDSNGMSNRGSYAIDYKELIFIDTNQLHSDPNAQNQVLLNYRTPVKKWQDKGKNVESTGDTTKGELNDRERFFYSLNMAMCASYYYSKADNSDIIDRLATRPIANSTSSNRVNEAQIVKSKHWANMEIRNLNFWTETNQYIENNDPNEPPKIRPVNNILLVSFQIYRVKGNTSTLVYEVKDYNIVLNNLLSNLYESPANVKKYGLEIEDCGIYKQQIHIDGGIYEDIPRSNHDWTVKENLNDSGRFKNPVYNMLLFGHHFEFPPSPQVTP